MAVNIRKKYNKINRRYSSNNSRGSSVSSRTLLTLNLVDERLSDTNVIKMENNKSKSPYLAEDSSLAIVTEKKLVNKKNVVSSFPLAGNIYKASSDEFKLQRDISKKMKKSVLTLPNVPAVAPQTCTVSDMNDSEFNASDDNKKQRPKKRFVAQHRNAKIRSKRYNYYDRDARDCSQMDINLESSSTDVVNHFKGDCQNLQSYKRDVDKDFSAHDMWTVLRNINKFQFRPSPPISNESIKSQKKKKTRNKKKNNRRDSRLIETCHTEEFSYISSFEIENNSQSSFDRITVIDRQDNFNEMHEEYEKGVFKTSKLKLKNSQQNGNKNKKISKIDNAITQWHTIPANNHNYNDPKLRDNKIECVLKENINCRHKTIGDRNPLTEITLLSPEPNFIENEPKEKKSSNRKYARYKETNNTALRLQSRSSKIDLNYVHSNNRDNNEKVLKVSSNESAQPIKGITQVVLSGGQDTIKLKCDERKPRLIMTMPSSDITPRVTQTDIKRKLRNIKFPLIILGKDQISTTPIKVTNEVPLQFHGLDKQIWPFMHNWYNIPVPENVQEISKKSLKSHQRCSKHKQPNVPLINHNKSNEVVPNEIHYSAINNNKLQKYIKANQLSKIQSQQARNSHTNHQLKDKMIKLLYKNNSVKSIEGQCDTDGHDGVTYYKSVSNFKLLRNVEKADASTETNRKHQTISAKLSKTTSIQQANETKRLSKFSRPKGRWASDFIDSVIRKIRNGIYYSKEHQYIHNVKPVDSKEVSTQTLLLEEKCQTITEHRINETNLTADNTLDSVNTLLGFDEQLPVLVKTLNMKELSIKHCTTNVMIQFDINLPSDTKSRKSLENSLPVIPLSITKSHTKIIKCDTTIMNAMLPAEICSIIPVILKSIIGASRISTLSTVVPYHSDTNLYTISEMSTSESSNVLKCTFPTVMGFSSTLKKLLNGTYSHRLSRIAKKKEYTEQRFNFGFRMKDAMLYTLQTIRRFITLKVYFNDYRISLNTIKRVQAKPPFISTAFRAAECNAVFRRSPYVDFQRYNLINLLKSMWIKNFSFSLRINAPLDSCFQNNKVLINVQIGNLETEGNGFITMKNFEVCNRHLNSEGHENYGLLAESCPKAIEYKTVPGKENINKKKCGVLIRNKKRKNSFVTIYKKCKSTSNVSTARNTISLNKLTSLDDFFQVFGTENAMSTVFSGQIGDKILSAILEMKNWITEISAKQAMLILLLVNKKETLNLVRFRPVILQGIAVNRITQASELDMEIEVIERENFNKFSAYDEASCLLETVDKRNNLFEELRWIAKTTASDYQKPFNVSSENLLKSLLEKRKKLNPSYLRVMARYVGLGLLKSPGIKK